MTPYDDYILHYGQGVDEDPYDRDQGDETEEESEVE